MRKVPVHTTGLISGRTIQRTLSPLESCENATITIYRSFPPHLTELLNAGFIRRISTGEQQGFRVKFVHASNGSIYLQRDSDSPAFERWRL